VTTANKVVVFDKRWDQDVKVIRSLAADLGKPGREVRFFHPSGAGVHWVPMV
jgi:hypothetical protein